MAMPWGLTLWMIKMVWLAFSGWVTSCLTVADEVASSLRAGDIGLSMLGDLSSSKFGQKGKMYEQG